jgi:hypothetical protein
VYLSKKMRADRGLAADGPVRDAVEVLREDPLLPAQPGVEVLEVLGELGLLDLAREGPLAVARVEVADQLHRQRRAALHVLVALQVLDGGADDALEVDALVLVEARVLDRDRRFLHR